MTLAEFFTARLDEDELAAKIAAVDDAWDELRRMIPLDAGTLNRCHRLMNACSPARVLREVEAKRKILEHWQDLVKHDAPGNPDPDEYEDYTVRPLVAIWSDHPDYDPEWRP